MILTGLIYGLIFFKRGIIMGKEFRPIPGTDLCPCESGRVYGECCEQLGIWGIDEHGEIVKRIDLSSLGEGFFEEYLKVLEKRLGRPLKGDDRLFPDFNPKEFNKRLVEGIIATRIHPKNLYCFFLMDGLIVTDTNFDRLEGRDRMFYEAFSGEYDDFDDDERVEVLSHLMKLNTDLGYSEDEIFEYIIEAEGRDL